jgi:predicted metal-dependent RNase
MADEVSPEEIILVHGEEAGTKALAEKLSGKYEVHTPKNGEKIILE